MIFRGAIVRLVRISYPVTNFITSFQEQIIIYNDFRGIVFYPGSDDDFCSVAFNYPAWFVFSKNRVDGGVLKLQIKPRNLEVVSLKYSRHNLDI